MLKPETSIGNGKQRLEGKKGFKKKTSESSRRGPPARRGARGAVLLDACREGRALGPSPGAGGAHWLRIPGYRRSFVLEVGIETVLHEATSFLLTNPQVVGDERLAGFDQLQGVLLYTLKNIPRGISRKALLVNN